MISLPKLSKLTFWEDQVFCMAKKKQRSGGFLSDTGYNIDEQRGISPTTALCQQGQVHLGSDGYELLVLRDIQSLDEMRARASSFGSGSKWEQVVNCGSWLSKALQSCFVQPLRRSPFGWTLCRAMAWGE